MQSINFQNASILFYDGECGFCNHAVQFVLKHEKDSSLFFSALQSEFATKFLTQNKVVFSDFSTIYFWENEKLSSRSTAALKVAKHLRFPYSMLVVFSVIPRFLRDEIYRLIARFRKRIAGSYCVLLNAEQTKRLLT